MLNRIKAFFQQQLADPGDSAADQTIALAAAALLIEVSRADFEKTAEEMQAIKHSLQQVLSIASSELDTLIALAEEENRAATSLQQFTRLITENYSMAQRYQLVRALWRVAHADGKICAHEEHLIRKIADLIYLPHGEFIRAKLSVVESQQ